MKAYKKFTHFPDLEDCLSENIPFFLLNLIWGLSWATTLSIIHCWIFYNFKILKNIYNIFVKRSKQTNGKIFFHFWSLSIVVLLNNGNWELNISFLTIKHSLLDLCILLLVTKEFCGLTSTVIHFCLHKWFKPSILHLLSSLFLISDSWALWTFSTPYKLPGFGQCHKLLNTRK